MKVLDWTIREKPQFDYAKIHWGNPLAYEQSWLYVNQAMRRGGWVCTGSDGWMAVARDYRGPGRHVAIVPISRDLGEFLSHAMAELQSHGIKVETIKHIPEESLESVLSNASFVAFRHPVLTDNTYLDDISEDRLPQVLINIDQDGWTRDDSNYFKWIEYIPTGPAAREFRYQIRRFCRLYLAKEVTFAKKPIMDTEDRQIDKALSNWLDSVRKRFAQTERPQVCNFAACFVEPIKAVTAFSRECPREIIGFVISLEDVPQALWIGTQVSQLCFSVNVLIANTSIVGLSDFTLYLAIREAQRLGLRWVNLGGSEIETLFRFKHKLCRGSQAPCQLRRVFDVECRGGN